MACAVDRLSPPMRIAYLDHTAEMGGAEHLLLTLLKGIVGRGIDPMFVCAQDGPLPEAARGLGVRTLVVMLPAFQSLSVLVAGRKVFNPLAVARNCFLLLLCAVKVARCLKAERIECVQTNSAFSHLYGGLAARLLRVPCLWYMHDLTDRSRLRGGVALTWRVLARLLATQVVADSRAALQALGVAGCALYAGHPENEPHSRAEENLRSRLALPEEALLVGYVGRIAYVKGLDILAEAAQIVVQVDPRVHFVLIGDALFGDTGYHHTIRNLVAQARLEDHWHGIGYDPEAAARMAETDLIVLPSRREALGLVLLEAGLAGKAVVASQVGGIPEIVVDGETGLLVDPQNPQQLADAILRLIADPARAAQMGQSARERVRCLFSPARYYAEFSQLYERIRSR